MSTQAGDRSGLRGAAKVVADRARTLVQLEIQLAVTEVRQKLASIGIGIGLFAAAAILLIYAVGFALAAIAAGLATAVSTWLALLIVTIGLVLVVAGLVAVGRVAVQRGAPPVPEQAIQEAKLTLEAVQNGKH
jgi:Putative Actinobacterial Holin-X, holin superfamily III